MGDVKKYLLDTNIFLEILLGQEKREICKDFLIKNIHSSCISDFSFFSIGILLTKRKMFNTYNSFYEDIILHVDLLSLNKEDMKQIPSVSSKHSFDFDDAYQYCIAQKYNLTIVTMDKDFSKLKSSMVYFI